MTIIRPAPPGLRAVRMFLPTVRPVTSPEKLPSSRAANADVMSLPFRLTRTVAASVPAANFTATSASPPEMRSARFESTSIEEMPSPAERATFAPASASPMVTASAISAAIAADTRSGVAAVLICSLPLGGSESGDRP